MHPVFRAAVLLLPLVAGGARAEPELHLLVAESSPLIEAPDRANLRRLYLGQRTRVAGHRTLLVAPAPGSPSREAFNARILRMSEDELAAYWIEQALLGGALPPLEVEDLKAMCSRIRGRPGALGYVLQEAGELEDLPGVRALPLAPRTR